MPVPVGTTPLSAWEYAQLGPTPAPIPILADRIDPKTGEFESLTRGRSIADAAVIQTFRTRRDSGAAARGHGHRFDRIRYAEDASRIAIDAELRAAVQHLVDQNVILVDRVQVELADGEDGSWDWGEGFLRYIDVLSQEAGQFPAEER